MFWKKKYNKRDKNKKSKKKVVPLENQTLVLAEEILCKYSECLANLTKIQSKLADTHDITRYFENQREIVLSGFDDLQKYLAEINLRKFTYTLMEDKHDR